MIVYADILVLLNMTVDYFLLAITARLIKSGTRIIRHILAAFLGGLSSITIFLPPLNVFWELIIRIFICLLLSFTAFGFGTYKRFFRATAVFFAVSVGYAGGMLAVWQLFNLNGIIIHNSVVYFNISPLFLIVFSVIGYFLILLLNAVLKKNASFAKQCDIKLFIGSNTASFTALSDTGNSLEDSFGTGEVIIADKSAVELLLGGYTTEELSSRYRVLPCNTVIGSELLEGYRCDKAYITYEGRTTEISCPILAVSKQPIKGEHSLIINPKILE
ncbi:MAG: hypothetical protein E7562_04840 [Ruminococcaceae bacterium]|nr:hypothetical protein [Oscillospiraceae bacterium]